MSFLHPWVLLLLLVPILLSWSLFARRAGLAMPFDGRTHSKHTLLRWTLAGLEAVPLLLLSVAIVAAAGPQKLKLSKQRREVTNIQICMDVSGSMAGERYENASQAISDFTRMREGDEFGLILFGNQQIRWVPLTKDLEAVRNAMPFANPDRQPPQMRGTQIGAAMLFAKKVLDAEVEDQTGDRMIIVVSDGESGDFGDGFEYEVADELKRGGITVYYIHVAEGDIPLETAEMARETGGEAIAATDPESLRGVFQHIDRMRRAKTLPASTIPLDHFAPFAIAALVLLGMHSISLMGVRYTPW